MLKSLFFPSPISSSSAAAAASLQGTILQASLDLNDLSQSIESGSCIVQQCDAVSNSQENGRERG
ncbi:hypothetical protein [Neorickettsia risticii]|uniref:hypothetical protein n=1 Tax=Neorickettsia risticii TaxID=950 RepID=UPI00059BFB6F|nr:hypothetical protein [Neorickettsia risticii]